MIINTTHTGPHQRQPVVPGGAPLGDSQTAVILVHGRGAGPHDIMGLAAALNRPQVTYLAPTAAGNTWYPYSFLTDTAKNEPFLTSALQVLEDMVSELGSHGIRQEHIVFLGFSQGACLSSEFAVRHAERFGGVIAFSGGWIGPPGTTWDYAGNFRRTPVFLGCSDIDPHIPSERVDESEAVFTRMGAEVTKRIYAGMGHTVNEDEIRFARGILDRVLAEQ